MEVVDYEPLAVPKKTRLGTRKDKTANYEADTARRKQNADKQKERMAVALSTVASLSQGLIGLDFGMIKSVLTDEELSTWVRKARESASQLRKFANIIKET